MIHITISDDLKEELKKEAEKLEMSLNTYIRMILINRKDN